MKKPRSKLFVQHIEKKEDLFIKSLLLGFNFVNQISIVHSSVSDSLNEINLNNGDIKTEFYMAASFSISQCFTLEFIETFFQRSCCKFSFLSHTNSYYTENSFSFLSSGIFVASITKESYECLGLQGKPENHCRKSFSKRYRVMINMLDFLCKDNEKKLHLIQDKFSSKEYLFGKDCWVLFSCLNPHCKIMSKSILEKHFKFFFGIKPEIRQIVYNDFPAPQISVEKICHNKEILEIYEWLGASLNGINMKTFSNLTDFSLQPELKVKSMCGCFSGINLYSLSESIKGCLDSESNEDTWIALSFSNFVNSPIVYRCQENIAFKNHELIKMVLFLYAFSCLFFSWINSDNWAVLVGTSRSWFNYRHVANVLSIYHTVKRLGIPDSNIILMIADDMACNPRNIRPATIFNDRSKHYNLYGFDTLIDYRGKEVTVENFIRVLTGRHSDGIPYTKKLSSSISSNVLIYMSGHGGDGFLKFQDSEELLNDELADALHQMWTFNRYHKLMFVIDTCQAQSMISQLYSPNVFAISSSLIGEDSISHHIDSGIGVYVMDRFTHYAFKFLQKVSKGSRKTLLDFTEVCSKYICGSTVNYKSNLLNANLSQVLILDFFSATTRPIKII